MHAQNGTCGNGSNNFAYNRNVVTSTGHTRNAEFANILNNIAM